jgi:hypothetical protein
MKKKNYKPSYKDTKVLSKRLENFVNKHKKNNLSQPNWIILYLQVWLNTWKSVNKSHHMGLEVWPKQYNICFASAKPWVQTPGPPKKKKNVNTWIKEKNHTSTGIEKHLKISASLLSKTLCKLWIITS